MEWCTRWKTWQGTATMKTSRIKASQVRKNLFTVSYNFISPHKGQISHSAPFWSWSTPIRKRKGHSFSGSCDVSSENPLTYKDKAKYHGFDITDILYPHCDILPPFLYKILIKKMT